MVSVSKRQHDARSWLCLYLIVSFKALAYKVTVKQDKSLAPRFPQIQEEHEEAKAVPAKHFNVSATESLSLVQRVSAINAVPLYCSSDATLYTSGGDVTKCEDGGAIKKTVNLGENITFAENGRPKMGDNTILTYIAADVNNADCLPARIKAACEASAFPNQITLIKGSEAWQITEMSGRITVPRLMMKGGNSLEEVFGSLTCIWVYAKK